MTTSIKPGSRPSTEDRPFSHLRATAEERARILSALVPFDSHSWQREVTPPTPEELAALEEFLREREEERWQSLQLEQQHLTGRGG